MAEIPPDYRKDFGYLKDLSDKHSLKSNNAILQKLEQKAKNLPGLKEALEKLNINYV